MREGTAPGWQEATATIRDAAEPGEMVEQITKQYHVGKDKAAEYAETAARQRAYELGFTDTADKEAITWT